MNPEKEKPNRIEKANSLAIALLICVPAVNNIVTAAVPGFAGSFMTLVYAFVSTWLTIACAISLIKHPRIKATSLFVFTIIIVYYVLSASVTRQGGKYFTVYFIIPYLSGVFLVYRKQINAELLLLYTMVIPAAGVLVIKKIFLVGIYGNSITMGQSYAFLTPVLANITYIIFYLFKKKRGVALNLLIIIVSAINVAYLMQILLHGSRGPIISIILCLIFCYGFRYHETEGKLKVSGIRFWILAIIGAIGASRFWNILEWLNTLVDSEAVRKILFLHKQGNLLNNRVLLYQLAMENFHDRPFFGHGIASFEYYTGQNYPHNLFIQLLFDGGIFLTTIVTTILVISIIKFLKHCDFDEYTLFVFLFFGSFFKSLVSGDIWENEKFWLLFGYLTCLLQSSRLPKRYGYQELRESRLYSEKAKSN